MDLGLDLVLDGVLLVFFVARGGVSPDKARMKLMGEMT